MGADIRENFNGALQRFFRIPFLALDERKEQNNIPIAYREDNADEDFAFLPQFVQRAVSLQNEMLDMRLPHFGRMHGSQPEYLQKDFSCELRIKATKKVCQWGFCVVWLIHFDFSHSATSLFVTYSSGFTAGSSAKLNMENILH
jgi:hypothetical protein